MCGGIGCPAAGAGAAARTVMTLEAISSLSFTSSLWMNLVCVCWLAFAASIFMLPFLLSSHALLKVVPMMVMGSASTIRLSTISTAAVNLPAIDVGYMSP